MIFGSKTFKNQKKFRDRVILWSSTTICSNPAGKSIETCSGKAILVKSSMKPINGLTLRLRLLKRDALAAHLEVKKCLKIQFGSNQWIQGITYLCTERIFACPQFVYIKIFLKNSYKLVIYIFTLLLTTFASKSAKY